MSGRGKEKVARKERLLVGDLVEVESCDDGFEGCFCEVRSSHRH